MKVRDLIELLEQDLQIVFMAIVEGGDAKEICTCQKNSEGVVPYLDREVVSWKVSPLMRIVDDITIVITMRDLK